MLAPLHFMQYVEVPELVITTRRNPQRFRSAFQDVLKFEYSSPLKNISEVRCFDVVSQELSQLGSGCVQHARQR